MLAFGLILGTAVLFAANYGGQRVLKPLINADALPLPVHSRHTVRWELSDLALAAQQQSSAAPQLPEPLPASEIPKSQPQITADQTQTLIQTRPEARQPEFDNLKQSSAAIAAPHQAVPQESAPAATSTRLGNQAKWSNVFDSRLREQLEQHAQRRQIAPEDYAITSYRNNSGDWVAQYGERCFTLRDSDTSPTGKQWSLPQRCYGVESESDTMARNLQQAMRRRFGSTSAQN